jgi:type II secretory pathway component PulJ
MDSWRLSLVWIEINKIVQQDSYKRSAFTLAEILVSVAVLALLVVLVSQLMNSAVAITTIGNKRLDSDNQARPILDRMAQDISQIIKRSDLDYYLKVNKKYTGPTQAGNDQLAFFSNVEGYSTAGSQSHLSLVSYRVNSSNTANRNKLERLGKGLDWNGDPTVNNPIVFSPLTIAGTWPAATSSSTTDGDYEPIGPQIFRFEYYYQLQSGDLNDSPWDDINPSPSHTTVSGLRDVGAIVVVIATIDPKSRVLINDAQLTTLAGQMDDYSVYKPPGNSGKVGPQPQVQWQDAVNASAIPTAAKAGIRFYQRYFYLNGLQQ